MDFYDVLKRFVALLNEVGRTEDAANLLGAVESGATGSEIMMATRHILSRLPVKKFGLELDVQRDLLLMMINKSLNESGQYKSIFPDLIVHDIAGSKAIVETVNPSFSQNLKAIGFHLEKDRFVKRLPDDETRLEVIERLIDMEAVFVTGRGWSPDELVRYYRQEGRINRPHRAIRWTKPDQFQVECVFVVD